MNRSKEDIKMALALELIKAGITEPRKLNKAVNLIYQNVIK